jgi:hypothetical protein
MNQEQFASILKRESGIPSFQDVVAFAITQPDPGSVLRRAMLWAGTAFDFDTLPRSDRWFELASQLSAVVEWSAALKEAK